MSREGYGKIASLNNEKTSWRIRHATKNHALKRFAGSTKATCLAKDKWPPGMCASFTNPTHDPTGSRLLRQAIEGRLCAPGFPRASSIR